MIRGAENVIEKSVENKPLQVLGKMAMDLDEKAPEYERYSNDEDFVADEIPNEYIE